MQQCLTQFVFVQNPRCEDDGDLHSLGPLFFPVAETVTPHWLKAVAPDARVNSNILKIFDSFRDGDQCLAQVMQSVTGKTSHNVPSLCSVVTASGEIPFVHSSHQCPLLAGIAWVSHLYCTLFHSFHAMPHVLGSVQEVAL